MLQYGVSYGQPCEAEFVFAVDPRATYLHTDSDNAQDAAHIDLEVACVFPGDRIRLETLGDWDCGGPCDDTVSNMFGVFSSSDLLLPRSERHRVPDAIAAGQNATTEVSHRGGTPTDIPEDFIISGNRAQRGDHTCLVVPEGATHLFMSPNDSLFEDNTDPDGDYAVRITAAVDCPLATRDVVMTRSTIDGGGIMRSKGGGIEMSGTVGQPDAGVLAAKDAELTGGFWFEIPVGDCEDDGDVDLGDFKDFDGCITGPEPTPALPTGCRCFDFDNDHAVALRDFGLLQQVFRKGVPAGK